MRKGKGEEEGRGKKEERKEGGGNLILVVDCGAMREKCLNGSGVGGEGSHHERGNAILFFVCDENGEKKERKKERK